jgi:RES domain-containing protein
MMPLPSALGSGGIFLWRLDASNFSDTWDSGEGSFRVGGRWNSAGVRVVYAALDPATAILEVAVHKGFSLLDTKPHILTSARLTEGTTVKVITPADIPNPNWLRPGVPSAGQQAFGDRLLREHAFVAIPSVVSSHSWNIIFDPALAVGKYVEIQQEMFALDGRLHPPAI